MIEAALRQPARKEKARRKSGLSSSRWQRDSGLLGRPTDRGQRARLRMELTFHANVLPLLVKLRVSPQVTLMGVFCDRSTLR